MPKYANVWPAGGLFAFSGVDGTTCHAEPFVAGGCRDGIGWDFWLRPRVKLRANFGPHRLVALDQAEDYCFSDCWSCSVEAPGAAGTVRGAFLDRFSMAVTFEFAPVAPGAQPRLVLKECATGADEVAVAAGMGWWLAVCHRDGEKTCRTQAGAAVSYRSEAEAIRRAQDAAYADVAAAAAARLRFYASLTVPKQLAGESARAFYRAASVQKVNIESAQRDIPCRWTTPDRMPHRHMWLWDTAFHALGLMHYRPDLAEEAIRALFSKQQPDGKLLLAAQPGEPERQETETQPPVLAWAVWLMWECCGRRNAVEEFYPALMRYIEWFERNRRNNAGLFGWAVRTGDHPITGARGAESGMDNSPRFDQVEQMTAADLCGYMASEYLALEKLAKILDKKSEDAEWRARRQRIVRQTNTVLWDKQDQFYYDLDEQGAFIRLKTCAGIIPMLGHIPDPDRGRALAQHVMNPAEFWAPFPVATVAQDEPAYTNDCWRGCTWASMNVLMYYCLGAYGFTEAQQLLARRTLEEIARWYDHTGCLWEYYDSQGRTSPPELDRKGAPGEKGGLGFGVIADLHWTAAAYIHIAHLVS